MKNPLNRTDFTRITAAQDEQDLAEDEPKTNESERERAEDERVKAYLAAHPEVPDCEIADALTISRSTVNKWRKRLKAADG